MAKIKQYKRVVVYFVEPTVREVISGKALICLSENICLLQQRSCYLSATFMSRFRSYTTEFSALALPTTEAI
jgi:hypothetical protein